MVTTTIRYCFSIVFLWLTCSPCQAQREYYNWYFGNRAGITFLGGVRPLLDGDARISLQGASQSDSTGRFVFASDGYRIFNREGILLANGDSIGVQNFTYTRDVLSVRQPGRANRYYLFNEINKRRGVFFPAFGYSVVDMSQNGGLGRVVEKNRVVTLPGNSGSAGGQQQIYSNSDFAMVKHANGRDQWLILQTSQRQYVSFLLTSTGLDSIPVISLAARGSVNTNAASYSSSLIRASPNGKKLVVVDVEHVRLVRSQQSFLTKYLTTELADFDPQSGRVSNPMLLVENFVPRTQIDRGSILGVAGLSFSPDGSKLYLDTINSREIWQYNLLAGSANAIGASRTVCGRLQQPAISTSNLQLGPDGKIYVANDYDYLGRIETPNALGVASRYQDSAVFLGFQRSHYQFLPKTTNDLNLPPVVVTGAGSIAAGTTCAGETVQFSSSLSPFLTATAYAWDFGDPASGLQNSASGQAPAHRYGQSGTYTVTLRVSAADGQQYTSTQAVRVLPVPQVALLSDTLLCESSTKLLSPGPQPVGSTYRWQDGSTSSTFLVVSSGRYEVTVTNPTGCSQSAATRVQTLDCPNLPNIITPGQDGRNETFVLRGLMAAEWRCRIFSRWGHSVFEASSYANDWNAGNQPAGVYFYELVNTRTGQRLKGTLEVVK